MEASLLHCPIRGSLRARQRAADGLTFTEEKHRIDAIRYLVQRGYPKENFGIETTIFKLGHAGRSSFRTDFAIYDEPYAQIRALAPEERITHLRLLAEIKRDNQTAKAAKATQVSSALHLVPDLDALGVYWDDIEQRFFYRKVQGRQSKIIAAPVSKIPAWGSTVGSIRLTYADLEPAKDLVGVLDTVEDEIHTSIVDKSARYTLIQQLLLLKIFDENLHKDRRARDKPLDFQDFSAEPISDAEGMRQMNSALARAAAYYNVYLPAGKKLAASFSCDFNVLRNATRILAPINVSSSKAQLIQQFYMKFAKGLYKWDLAQYFTPHEVIDFIVDLVNPLPGEHACDPAAGSADFLISVSRRRGNPADPYVWGADNSEQAVQVGILNMMMNGAGKPRIENHDSLAKYNSSSQQYPLVLCNPPFGTKIVERRYEVLRKFDTAHKWAREPIGASRTDVVRESQQTGILFAELCVRLTQAGGRTGIILPNGYLGNRSIDYVALREWLLRHCKLVAVVAFPRFTFKKSGADVSASVVILERRSTALARASDSEDYEFFVGNIESVGWRAGDKKAVPLYVQDATSGELVLDEENEPTPDADFAKVLNEYLRSSVADCFPWTMEDRRAAAGAQARGIDIARVAALSDLNLDPKRYSEKFATLRANIKKVPHFRLGDLLEIAPATRVKIERSRIYSYVEIENVGVGEYDYLPARGWQLPARARLPADPGDIFIAHLWSCAGKWFMAAGECSSVIVTNGCTRLRVLPGKEHLLPHLAVGLCSESFCVQLRGFATGSDGLAEIGDADLLEIVLPKIGNEVTLAKVEKNLTTVISGDFRFAKFASRILAGLAHFRDPPRRKSHVSLL